MKHSALVVEGPAEHGAVPILVSRLNVDVARPIVFNGQGVDCPVATLVEKKLLKAVIAGIAKQPTRVIVIIDRESRAACPGEFAQELEQELHRQLRAKAGYKGAPGVFVVCADCCLENWLIADPSALRKFNYIGKDITKRVGNNADGVDAIGTLKWAYQSGKHYDKVRDAPAIAKNKGLSARMFGAAVSL